MKDEPLDAVYAYVERAYIRIQAGDLLLRCIETGSSDPIKQTVEGLVLAGPKSLEVLREMLSEAIQRKVQLLDDLSQIFTNFESSLSEFGLALPGIQNASVVSQLTSTVLLDEMKKQGILDGDRQVRCLQIMRDSRDLINSLIHHIHLLEEIEALIQDWLWGLAIQSARQTEKLDPPVGSSPSL
jgi:hypothetical protein